MEEKNYNNFSADDDILHKIESGSIFNDGNNGDSFTINPNRIFKQIEKSYLKTLMKMNNFFRSKVYDVSKTYDKEKSFLLLNVIGNLHEYFQKDFPPGWKDRNIGISNYKKNPVVLLHGYGNNRGVFIDMAEKLREHGFELVYRLNHNFWIDIKKNIKQINSKIDHIIAETNPKSGKVDIIGHSLGGLTARYYSYLYPEKVDYCIMLGAPHKGTYLAYFGLFAFLAKYLNKETKVDGMSAFQMTPGSKFIREINAMKPAPSVKYINVFTEYDELVVLKDSEFVKEYINIDVKKDTGIDGIGHGGLLHDPGVIDLICEILNNTYGKEAKLQFYVDYDEDYKKLIPVRG